MNAKVASFPLSFLFVLGCIVFSANCESHYQEMRPSTDERRSSSSRKMMEDVVPESCVRNICRGGSTCYCCETLLGCAKHVTWVVSCLKDQFWQDTDTSRHQ